MNDILEKIDVTIQDLEECAFALVVPSSLDNKKNREKFRVLTKRYLADVNVLSLLWAGYLLHEKFKKEKPEINKEDPVNLVADEILGLNIANYIAGTNAIFNFYKYDNEKPGVLSQLEPMLDDIIGGFVAGIMTKLFEEENTVKG